jgi:hypothetical protein
MMLVEQLDEAQVETIFFCGWDCIEDILLTLKVGVVAGGVAGGLATGVLACRGRNAAEKIFQGWT